MKIIIEVLSSKIDYKEDSKAILKDSRVCKYQSLKNTSMDTIKWLEKRPHF